jgi:hypothetical protein
MRHTQSFDPPLLLKELLSDVEFNINVSINALTRTQTYNLFVKEWWVRYVVDLGGWYLPNKIIPQYFG